MENRNGLLVDLRVDSANGIAERYDAISMLEDNIPGAGRITVAADKGYDDATFVEACRMRNVTPHVAQNLARPGGSAIDGRTTQTPAINSVSASVNASKRSSGGSRPSAGSGGPDSEVEHARNWLLISQALPTTSLAWRGWALRALEAAWDSFTPPMSTGLLHARYAPRSASLRKAEVCPPSAAMRPFPGRSSP